MRWAGHVTCMGRVGMRIGFCGKTRGKRKVRRLDMGGWMILKWILERWDRLVYPGLVWFRIGDRWRAL
jgi:hypothetical protein